MHTQFNEEKMRAKTRHQFWQRAVKLLNIGLVTLPFAVCWYLYYAERIVLPFFRKGNWYIILFFAVMYALFCRIYGALHVSTSRISALVYSQSLSALLADFVLYMVSILLRRHLQHLWPFIPVLAVQLAVAVLWSLYTHRAYFRRNKPQVTMVVWDMRQGLEELVNSYGMEKRFNVVGTPRVEEVVANLSLLDGVETVFLCGIHSHERNIVIKYCVAAGIHVYVIPRIGDVIMDAAKPVNFFHLPMMSLERSNPSPEYMMVKRAFDILVSGLGLILLSPVMGVIALLIRRDGGTVLYRQKRLTQNGRTFELLKFRSMRMDAEGDGVARLSSGEHDPRVTKVGRVIRGCRLDELPQLWNILVGDMAFVGPRPERPEIAAAYEKELPEFSLRLQVKAGLTGYAQVYGKYNTTPYDKLLLDLRYISRPSLTEDFKILLATVKILFLPESTEGVAEGSVTAADGDTWKGDQGA